jgi:hypothetical protein
MCEEDLPKTIKEDEQQLMAMSISIDNVRRT